MRARIDHTIEATTAHKYHAGVVDKFDIDTMHEVGRDSAHISMSRPDTVTGRGCVFSVHLKKAEVEALHQLLGDMLRDWDTHVIQRHG